jgi:secondary thiamine-phosphate synthase enzyme
MHWHQRELRLPPLPRGFHVITRTVVDALPELAAIRIGLLHAVVCHTSASLSINENADPDVPRDLAMAVDRIAAEDFPYSHTLEGRDDMPAHVKAALVGTSVTIPVRDGRLLLGTWQGIHVWEHRIRPHRRRIAVPIAGT